MLETCLIFGFCSYMCSCIFQIAFSSDSSVLEVGNAVIENRALCEAILESIIGEHGVSPATKRSLALRVSELLKEFGGAKEAEVEKPVEVSA